MLSSVHTSGLCLLLFNLMVVDTDNNNVDAACKYKVWYLEPCNPMEHVQVVHLVLARGGTNCEIVKRLTKVCFPDHLNDHVVTPEDVAGVLDGLIADKDHTRTALKDKINRMSDTDLPDVLAHDADQEAKNRAEDAILGELRDYDKARHNLSNDNDYNSNDHNNEDNDDKHDGDASNLKEDTDTAVYADKKEEGTSHASSHTSPYTSDDSNKDYKSKKESIMHSTENQEKKYEDNKETEEYKDHQSVDTYSKERSKYGVLNNRDVASSSTIDTEVLEQLLKEARDSKTNEEEKEESFIIDKEEVGDDEKKDLNDRLHELHQRLKAKQKALKELVGVAKGKERHEEKLLYNNDDYHRKEYEMDKKNINWMVTNMPEGRQTIVVL